MDTNSLYEEGMNISNDLDSIVNLLEMRCIDSSNYNDKYLPNNFTDCTYKLVDNKEFKYVIDSFINMVENDNGETISSLSNFINVLKNINNEESVQLVEFSKSLNKLKNLSGEEFTSQLKNIIYLVKEDTSGELITIMSNFIDSCNMVKYITSEEIENLLTDFINNIDDIDNELVVK
ncbi:hypothetical protein Murmansk-048 [Murmansk poxvirus]|uniref:Uncharacterized protein n=1 Tax=Murmansk poxvirus TaxID=2025359 RepID=A0A223FMM5_9POXV|nr:hypothetical protein CKM52_gp048 [Murmansk poxvirus]AST09243.1 hypothetical protein Murmansk-048 [Murmansk poxvirus]